MTRPRSLRSILRANASFATTTGLIALVATGPVARLLGIGEHRLVSATGAGLLLFAIALVLASGATVKRLRLAGRWISAADGLWVVASVLLVGVGGRSTTGNLVIAAIATIVGLFAALQLRAINRIDSDGPNQTVEVTRVLDGAVDVVWPVVIDHEAYGRLAPNLSRVLPTGPDGPELTRRCWDARGRHWDEHCVLWEDGVRFAVEVDTAADDYPYPLEYLRGEWAVRPIGTDHAEVTVRFELRPKPGAAGAAFATAMTTGATPILRRVLSGWQDAITEASRTTSATRPST